MPDTTQFGTLEDGQDNGLLPANTILVNRYKILTKLGGGGQGAVYQARDLNFPGAKRLVAVKEIINNNANDANRMAVFQREANILATLSHPAIPKIFDFFDQNSKAYLVMEYINGSDLELLINKTKELPIDKIIEWAIELCDVLDYLHSHEPEPIVFRDVKPANIMIDSLGKVRLIDFGIAKVFVQSANERHTMIGTEGYSAPEQYTGNVNTLSDIYSLGATFHHILTRKDPRMDAPFTFSERPIGEYNSKVPQGFIDIIDKALEKKPEDRFSSCAEMKAALLRVRYNPQAAMGAASSTASVSQGTSLFDDMDFAGTIEPRWTFQTEDELRGSPTTYRDMAFIGSYDTNMWSVSLSDGSFNWKYATKGGIAASPVIDEANRLVLFGSEDQSFTALDCQNGRIAWSYMTEGRVRGTARIYQEYTFFGSDDGYVYALVSGNGRFLWKYDAGAPVRSQPYIHKETIIVGSDAGEVIGLELSGKRKWGFRSRRGINASPIVDEQEELCYIGGLDGFMYCIDANSGYSIWRFRSNGPVISAAALGDGTLFFGSADGNVYALNAGNAREKWRFNADKPVVSAPVYHEGRVYIGGTNHVFYCLDAHNGKEIWSFQTENAITSTAHIVDNLILVSAMDYTLYALPLVT